MKNYYEIKIYTDKDILDPLIHRLENLGAEGFVIEDPEDLKEFLEKKNTYDWDYVDESVMELAKALLNVTFYMDIGEFNTKFTDLKGFKRKVLNEELVINSLEIKKVCDDDWKDNWKKYFKPAKISEKIVVVPTWEKYTPKLKDELIIKIDPGMAFGTGTHETTSLCIKLLEKHLKPNQSVLDVGCGSGILTIGATLLGAACVLGIDIDEEAVRVSKENILLNFGKFERKSSKIDIMLGDLTKGLNFKADIVVANLMADLVMMLAKDVAKHLKGESVFISSGILTEKKEQVSEAIKQSGFKIIEILEDGDWCAICAKLNNKR